MGLNGGGKHIELVHSLVVAVEIVLHHFHRFKLLKARLLGYLVFAGISIVLKVANVCDVAHIAHRIAEMTEIAEEDIKCDSRAGMTEMAVAIHSGATHIHTDLTGMDGDKEFLASGEGIVDCEVVGAHGRRIMTVCCLFFLEYEC